MKLRLETDRPIVSRRSPSTRYLVVRLTAPIGQGGPRPAVSVSLVLDRSGSMGGAKFELARQAVDGALRLLTPRDSFSVVVFDDRIDTVMSQSDAHAETRAEATRRLQEIRPRGSTDLCRGWLTGCGEVASRVAGDVIGRTLLLTDGLANHGETNPDVLADRAAELRRRGVSTSTFGVGADFDEALLGRLADAGGGAFHFLPDARSIPTMMATELGETLEVVARDVILTFQVPPNVSFTPIGSWRPEPVPDGFRLPLPDLVARQEVEVVVRFDLPATVSALPVRVTVQDRTGVLGAAHAGLEWVPGDEEVVVSQRVADALAQVVVDKERSFAREESVLLNRAGRLDEASARMRSSADVLGTLSGQSNVARQAAAEMVEESERLSQRLGNLEAKEQFYAATQVSRGFSLEGKRKKSS